MFFQIVLSLSSVKGGIILRKFIDSDGLDVFRTNAIIKGFHALKENKNIEHSTRNMV